MNNLLMEVENEIAVVTINRPKSLNALNSETLAELDQCFSEISPQGHQSRYPYRIRRKIICSRSRYF